MIMSVGNSQTADFTNNRDIKATVGKMDTA